MLQNPSKSAPAEGSKRVSEGPENKRSPKLSIGLGWKAWVNLTTGRDPTDHFPGL